MTHVVIDGRPIVADRHHIHHYLLARGFSHNQTLAILVAASGTFGAVGYLGWRFEVPEPVLFSPFFFGYFAYHFWIKREWKRLEGRETAPAIEPPEETSVAS